MTRTVLAAVEPPWGMTTPPTVHAVILTILGVVVAAFVVAALFDWRRTGRPTFLLMLVGGYVCSFNEALVDVLGHCFFPTDAISGYAAFGRAIPVWVILAYVIFFGGLPYLMSLAFARGVGHRSMWVTMSVFWVLNAVLEFPLLRSGLYVYYGDQPFAVGGFPLSWLVINSLGALFAAVVVTRLAWLFTGVRQLLVTLIPFATYMSSWVLAMPYFAVTNADVSDGVRAVAALASIALGVIAIDVLIRFGVGQWRLLPPDGPTRVREGSHGQDRAFDARQSPVGT